MNVSFSDCVKTYDYEYIFEIKCKEEKNRHYDDYFKNNFSLHLIINQDQKNKKYVNSPEYIRIINLVSRSYCNSINYQSFNYSGICFDILKYYVLVFIIKNNNIIFDSGDYNRINIDIKKLYEKIHNEYEINMKIMDYIKIDTSSFLTRKMHDRRYNHSM